MATDSNEVQKTTGDGAVAASTTPPRPAPAHQTVAKQAPTEQQESRSGVPKRFAPGQTVCSEKNEKGKLCNGHLKQMETAHPAAVHLRGDDVLHKCQTCGALYMGPPHGHVRDTRKQARYIQKDLAAILQAAGGTLPAYGPPKGPPRAATTTPTAGVAKAVAPAATKPSVAASARPAAAQTSSANAATTTAQADGQTLSEMPAVSTTASVSGTDSSPTADRHRPAAEAQAATGQPSAAPLSPAAATASPAAGAETPANLAPEASTELTPGAPPDERPQTGAGGGAAPAAAPPSTAPKSAAAKKASAHAGFKVPAELAAIPPGESQAEKIARLKRIVEEAKRAAGKLD